MLSAGCRCVTVMKGRESDCRSPLTPAFQVTPFGGRRETCLLVGREDTEWEGSAKVSPSLIKRWEVSYEARVLYRKERVSGREGPFLPCSFPAIVLQLRLHSKESQFVQ